MQNQALPEAAAPELRELDALRKNWYKGRHAASGREYWVYIPASHQAGTAAPLIMVLHGCAQPHWSHPWAIAYDTHMNQLAEEHQFLVVYPHHYAPPDINPMSCWDFYLPWNWRRGSGEPASLADIVQDMLKNTSRWTIDRQRIYVAGISSGGGETSNLGATYPDVFAAIAVHSGAEYGYFPQLLGAPAPAPDVLAPAPDALEPLSEEELSSGEIKLRTGLLPKGPDPEEQGKKAFQAMGHFARVVPAIVFHGTDDHVCDPENGDQATEQWITTNHLASGGDFTAAFEHPSSTASHPAGPHGERPYTVDTWQDVHGRDVVTYYRIDGMDHAWSGGTPGSIFTDPSGPDASKIIYEFFMAHPNPEPAGERGPLAAAPQVTLAELDRRLARIEALLAAPASSPQRAAGTPEPESGNE
jgi:poly(hydroxyalkanoate) depolymerase family esterase